MNYYNNYPRNAVGDPINQSMFANPTFQKQTFSAPARNPPQPQQPVSGLSGQQSSWNQSMIPPTEAQNPPIPAMASPYPSAPNQGFPPHQPPPPPPPQQANIQQPSSTNGGYYNYDPYYNTHSSSQPSSIDPYTTQQNDPNNSAYYWPPPSDNQMVNPGPGQIQPAPGPSGPQTGWNSTMIAPPEIQNSPVPAMTNPYPSGPNQGFSPHPPPPPLQSNMHQSSSTNGSYYNYDPYYNTQTTSQNSSIDSYQAHQNDPNNSSYYWPAPSDNHMINTGPGRIFTASRVPKTEYSANPTIPVPVPQPPDHSFDRNIAPQQPSSSPSATAKRRKRPFMSEENKQSGYAKFYQKTRKDLKLKDFKEASKVISGLWNKLTPDEKSIYAQKVSIKRKAMLKKKASQQAQELLFHSIELDRQ